MGDRDRSDPGRISGGARRQGLEERTQAIVDRLEEGIAPSQREVDFLIEANDRGFLDDLIGSSRLGFYDTLSEDAKLTLVQNIEINEAMDLGLVAGEPFFSGGGPQVLRTSETAAQAAQAAQGGSRLRGALQFIARHKKGLLAGVLGGAGLWGYFDSDEQAELDQALETAGVSEGQPDDLLAGVSPNDFMIVAPDGSVISASQLDPGLAASPQAAQSFSTPSLNSDLMSLAQANGINTSQLGLSFGGLPQMNPAFFGTKTVSETEFPAGIDVRGRKIEDPERFIKARTEPSPIATSPFFTEEARTSAAGYGAVVPPGAQINPRIFEPIDFTGRRISRTQAGRDDELRIRQVGTRDRRLDRPTPLGPAEPQPSIQGEPGTTLLGLAARAGRRYDVPLDVLYGTINATSGWDSLAVGTQGTRYGLAQLPENEISRTAAQNPNVALNVAAARLRRNYDLYGSWELAALEYKNKGAVTRLLEENEIDQGDKDWLNSALQSAGASGLGNQIFDFAGLAALQTKPRGSGRTGPIIPPFEAPDPATLADYTRRAVESIYGRDPSPEELGQFVEILTQGYREAYEQEVIKIRGGEAQDVDPEAQLLESLRTSGEGQFVTERQQTRSMFDTMGDWARILQEA